MFDVKISHKALCEIGDKWLKTKCKEKCPVRMVEMRSYCPEQPDVIGFNGSLSVLIEAKTSRSDFKADAKKHWRQHPNQGVGDYRLYICPNGLIKLEELPEKWGLLYVDSNNKVEVIVNPFIRNKETWKYENRFEKNHIHERNILYSALRRLN